MNSIPLSSIALLPEVFLFLLDSSRHSDFSNNKLHKDSRKRRFCFTSFKIDTITSKIPREVMPINNHLINHSFFMRWIYRPKSSFFFASNSSWVMIPSSNRFLNFRICSVVSLTFSMGTTSLDCELISPLISLYKSAAIDLS